MQLNLTLGWMVVGTRRGSRARISLGTRSFQLLVGNPHPLTGGLGAVGDLPWLGLLSDIWGHMGCMG